MKQIVIGIGLAIFLIGFVVFGRKLYIPLFNKIKGRETVQSIINNIEKDVKIRLQSNLNDARFQYPPANITLIAYKEQKVLEVYGQDTLGPRLIKSYPFTAYSGQLGPKLQKGDKQIPEGIYKIEYLNPNSTYYLSLKINFPNSFDLEKSSLPDKSQIGNDIFIHGKALTVGCIPIGDEAIEEVFWLVHHAYQNEVKVIISPRNFTLIAEYPSIENINWENELYDNIKAEIDALKM